MSDTTLLVLAKSPRPGRVKTRLSPALTPVQAAALALACLRDSLDAVVATPARRRVLVLDGPAGPWVPAGIEVRSQARGSLDQRIAAALGLAEGPALLIGMDTPQVSPALLDVDWSAVSAALGLAEDGGFWALGLREPGPSLVAAVTLGVPMSTAATGREQYRRLLAAGLSVAQLPVLRDVDRPADGEVVAALVPGSRFARCWSQLITGAPV